MHKEAKQVDPQKIALRVFVFLGGVAVANGIINLEVANGLIYVLYVTAITATFLYLVRPRKEVLDLLMAAVFGATVLAISTYRLPSQTDEETLVLYAAYLFRHGVDPYSVSLLDAYKVFPVAEPVVTVTLTPVYYVDVFGYPALYFELAALAYPQIVTVATMFLLYLFLRYRGVPELFFIVALIDGTWNWFTGGSFDIVSLALALVALTFSDWKRSALLALSGDVKQFALLYLPFIWKDYWGKWKELALNIVIPVVVFLVPNIPFISKEWAYDVLGPILQPIANQGVSISLLASLGLSSHLAYTVAFLLMYIVMIYIYRPVSRLKWLLPAFIWIVSWRDLSYFLFYVTAWVSSYVLESGSPVSLGGTKPSGPTSND